MTETVTGCRDVPLRCHERSCEVVCVERTEVLELLTDADELDREAKLIRNCYRDASLGTPIELRQRDPCDPDRVTKQTGLHEPVLPRRRVHNEQRLVRRAVQLPGDHAPDLRELLHQVRLRMQATSPPPPPPCRR
jgi:hypothetical protein